MDCREGALESRIILRLSIPRQEIANACESREQLSLEYTQFSDLKAKGIVSSLKERGKNDILLDQEKSP